MKKKEMELKEQFIFPNNLNNRNLVALPDRVWVMDLTEIQTQIEQQPEAIIKLFFLIDLASRKVVRSKLFKTTGHGAIRAKYIAKELKQEIERIKEIERESNFKQLMLHSDRGPEFVSASYQELFQQYDFLIGSMSEANEPNQNAVAERFARTIKYQLKKAPQIPKQVQTFQQLVEIVDTRIKIYNEKHKPRMNLPHKQTPEIINQALTKHEKEAPEIIVHWPQQTYSPVKDVITAQIEEFKQEALLRIDNRNPIDLLLNTEQQTLKTNRGITEIKHQVESLQETLLQRLEQIEQKLEKKGKKTPKRSEKPLRDPAGSPIYEYLLGLQRPSRISRRVWARNRISVTLLRYLGIRASELINISHNNLIQAVEKGTIQLYQHKSKSTRIIVLTDAAIKRLKSMKEDMLNAFIDEQTPLGVSISKKKKGKIEGVMQFPNWRKALNSFIKRTNDVYPGVYTSHSFRINIVTRLLRTVPIVEVRNIIGHKNVATTERYYRYQPRAHVLKQQIERAIEGDGEE